MRTKWMQLKIHETRYRSANKFILRNAVFVIWLLSPSSLLALCKKCVYKNVFIKNVFNIFTEHSQRHKKSIFTAKHLSVFYLSTFIYIYSKT